ncbi:TlpA family protein disulfide reductase [Botrimarina hoheduenensis]|uniref:Thiol-disulfide oxidoreductase ResA n=1 Tax=Botrimarina hoheduenensis TaxID=2528000 RepID=A0A5C5WCN9_9BACT|nr:TlpA disulfide reductase family protein [Botrimarina hoheduenensis]TWT48434.1 Thiol-disulfide oxidoreductase ResA [Botrimarina hoheduenensis]
MTSLDCFARLLFVACAGLGFWMTPLSARAEADSGSQLAAEASADPASPSYDWAESVGRLLGTLLGDADLAEEEEPSPVLGQQAPDFDLVNLQGDSVRLSELRGKIVVLDFWATWCGPCVATLPQLQELHESVGDDVRVIGLNQGEDLDAVRSFVAEKKLSFAQLLDNGGEVGDTFGANSIPLTVLIDREGTIQAVHSGYSSQVGAKLRSQIERVRRGETLFDAEAIAAVTAARVARLDAIRARFGPVNEHRLQEVGFAAFADDAYFDGIEGPQRFRLPSGNEALAMPIGQNRLAIIPFDGSATVETTLEWGADSLDPDGDPMPLCGFAPLVDAEGLKWVAAQEVYDEEWETVGFLVGLFDADGESVWVEKLPAEGDYSKITLAVGDLTGDSTPEIALQEEHYGAFNLTGAEDYLHVLSVRDLSGELLTRRWLSGNDGTGVFIVPSEEGGRLLVNLRDGAVFLRLNGAAE